jgi:acetylornithine deacetylase/succinyl-diaminopimelate desuccinylase-like protein
VKVDGPGAGGIHNDEAEAVLAAIDPEETIAYLRELVRVPSVNPPGDTSDAVAVCQRPLVAAGFRVRTFDNAPGKPNLVAEWGPEGGPSLAFNAHLDVVPIGDETAWSHPPFGAEIAAGRVYGRGAGDDKASVTAQVMGAIALARSGVPLRGRLVVTEVADEETSGGGANCVIAQAGLDVLGVIVGETAGVHITVSGRTAHGALPGKGRTPSKGSPTSSSP